MARANPSRVLIAYGETTIGSPVQDRYPLPENPPPPRPHPLPCPTGEVVSAPHTPAQMRHSRLAARRRITPPDRSHYSIPRQVGLLPTCAHSISCNAVKLRHRTATGSSLSYASMCSSASGWAASS